MQKIDIILLNLFFFICIFSTYINYLVRYQDWNRWLTFLPSFFFMFFFSYAAKYSKMPLCKFSAWSNSIGAFTGILVMHYLGEKINLTQSFGVVLLCLGLYIINLK